LLISAIARQGDAHQIAKESMAIARIHCRVFEGLCNRINCLASALATARPVYLRWAVNQHCPLPFEDIFHAIVGVKVTNEPVQEYLYEATPRKICWFYPKNVDSLPLPVFRAQPATTTCSSFAELWR
jgi:hypothetical protein